MKVRKKSPSLDLKKQLKADIHGWRITPPLYKWLQSQGDNATLVGPKHQKLLLSLASKRLHNSRAGAFHPSQLYRCEREQVFGFLGVPQKTRSITPETLNIFNDGTWRHIRWQVTFMMSGILTAVEVPVMIPGVRMTGSIDGVHDPDHWMIEIKGTSQFQQVVMYGALPQHIKQVHGYLFGRPDLDEAVIFYEDKATNHWHEVTVPRNRTLIRQVEGILSELNQAIDNRTLPSILPECQRGEGQYRTCPYAYACKQVGYSEAEAAQGFKDSEGVVTGLKLKKRNTHSAGAHPDRSTDQDGVIGARDAILVRTKGGTVRVRRGAAR